MIGFRLGLAAFLLSVTGALASPFDRDPSELGAMLDAYFSEIDPSIRIKHLNCKEGTQIRSCLYRIDRIEVVSQGKPSSKSISKISVSILDDSPASTLTFMATALALIKIYSPALKSQDAASMIASLTRTAVGEGKGSKIVDGVYYSAMSYGSQIDFFVMPE